MINMKEQLEQVFNFNHEGSQDISVMPRWISSADFHKQLQLIKEETQELEEAYENQDPIEVLDAMIDIAYVFFGMVCRFGFQSEFVEGFDIVHKNNMTKIFDADGNKILKMKEMVDADGKTYFKIAKPEGYQPVDLRKDFGYLEDIEIVNKEVSYFNFTTKGYLDAVEYLKLIGRYEEFNNNKTSIDGYSLIHFANSIKEKSYH